MTTQCDDLRSGNFGEAQMSNLPYLDGFSEPGYPSPHWLGGPSPITRAPARVLPSSAPAFDTENQGKLRP
jgi:hypothetical protein